MTVRAIEPHEFPSERKPFVVFSHGRWPTPVLHVLGFAQEALEDFQLRLFDYQAAPHHGCELSQVLPAEYHPSVDISVGRLSTQDIGAATKLRVEQLNWGGVSVIGTYPKMDAGGVPTLSGALKIRTNRPLTIKEARQVTHIVTGNHSISIPQREQQ